MRYVTGGAFRRALEDRLRTQSLESGVPLVRLRKLVAFERFVARLVIAHPGRWMLKGGLALQLRIGDRARTTKDIDLTFVSERVDALGLLRGAAAVDAADWMSYEVRLPESERVALAGQRFHVQCLVDARLFEPFHVDVGAGVVDASPPDHIEMQSLLGFAGVEPVTVPCYPVAQQLAEKIHAYSRPHPTGRRTRSKDLVDILLIAEMPGLEASAVRTSIEAVFAAAGTHDVPVSLADPPEDWGTGFTALANKLGLDSHELADASQTARRFLDPVLRCAAHGTWDPVMREWTGDAEADR